jgi:predicted nucleotidyltransferase component of viral defense system
MITEESRTVEWINSVRHGKEDPGLIERMVFAFTLSEQLMINGLNYVFKGGTSVSLITGNLRRFSIDIDIIVEPGIEYLPSFDKVIERGIFSHYEEDIRDNGAQGTKLPAKHYKFFYKSAYSKTGDLYILVDILISHNDYPKLIEVPISSKILSIKEPITMAVCPSIESLLGDKLTAFAPHTTGVQFGQDKTLSILKQLFDIFILYELSTDAATLFSAFENISKKELNYRDLNKLNIDEVARDTFDSSIMIASRGLIGDRDEYGELTKFISPIKSYIFNDPVSQDSLILWASRSAYLSASYLSRRLDLLKYEDDNLADLKIENPSFKRLNQLLKTDPVSFYFFYKSLDILKLL